MIAYTKASLVAWASVAPPAAPAIWVVTIGPAVIKFIEVIGPMTE